MKRTYTLLPYTEYSTTAFDTNRVTIDRVVLHSTAGTLQAAISTFSSPYATTSAHYIIDNDGKLWAGLEEYNVGYHAGNYPMNQRSIGIEHVDEGSSVKKHTNAQYATSAKLVRDVCTFYNIPIDSAHIIPHNQVIATACPNGLDVARIIREASETQIVDDCPAKLKQVTEERDRLNGVITGKDETISHLGDTINAKNAEIATAQTTISSLNSQVLNLTEQLATATEQAKKVPELTTNLNECELNKQNYASNLSSCKTQVGKIKSQLVPKKYLSLKLYNILMALE